MKVSTDACLQGAIAARYWLSCPPADVLDIGTGTGLLSLMLAQKLPRTRFTAIDIDAEAVHQAKANFAASPWTTRFQLSLRALQEFEAKMHFDAIICNPPFFHKHLSATGQQRHLARHDDSLQKSVLARKVSQLLSPEGIFCVLYPTSEWPLWQKTAAETGLCLHAQYTIRPFAHKEANRIVSFWGKSSCPKPLLQDICIYQPDKTYTPEAKALLQDYYLHL